ncbi:putative membrane protein [Helianthus anomalus]
MSSRFPSHQLNNGLYVSGRPEQPKERTPTMSSTAVQYTGGDIKKSCELGKMFDVDNVCS